MDLIKDLSIGKFLLTIFNFQNLSEEEIRKLICGNYQLNLFLSYIHEYLEGVVDVVIHKECHGLIRVKLQSRHVSSKQYLLLIQHGTVSVAQVPMSLVAAVIWYLDKDGEGRPYHLFKTGHSL